jgi:3-deoxy-7-phosphoheptulonate synthase
MRNNKRQCKDIHNINDTNIINYKPLLTPDYILHQYPLTNEDNEFIYQSRINIQNIIDKKDNRKIVIIGPCSIHDYDLAIKYAIEFKKLQNLYNSKLFFIMRVYSEKPRSSKGWKGFINDPQLNNTYNINDGLILTRKLYIELTKMKIPIACEFLETISAQYFADLVSWGAIGARTVESQIHRQMASGLSCPIGFKNSTSGSLDTVYNAIKFASIPQSFLGINMNGSPCIVQTSGNKYSHLILRGNSNGPNYDFNFVNNINQNVIIDCSHENSGKSWKKQIDVINYISNMIKVNSNYNNKVIGIMIESHINDGNQKLENLDGSFKNKNELLYGISITDECIGIKKTNDVIKSLFYSIH